MQWLVCQLHANELPLRHLFEHYDGRTTGPATTSGPISKQLFECENLPVVRFSPVTTGAELPVYIAAVLSTDQKYLLQICQAVASGHCPPELANAKPGKIYNSRWLTKASRILRLYIGTSRPNAKLRNLVEFLMKVYAPVWFAIRKVTWAPNTCF